MILILDNAAYHKARGPDWISPSKMKKAQLAEVLRQINVPSISGTDNKLILPK